MTVKTAGTSATFVKQDKTTQGNWIGVYGTQGYNVINSGSSIPSYATVTPAGQTNYTWSTTTTTTNALQDAPGTGSGRIAACWYSNSSFTVDVNVTDGQTHDIELYLLDYDHNNTRSETIQLSNAATGAVLDTETVSSFTSGVYMNWPISGNVLITITNQGGANAVLSGLFFDPPPVPSDTLSISGPTSYTAGTRPELHRHRQSPGSGTDTHYTGTIHFSSSDIRLGCRPTTPSPRRMRAFTRFQPR